MNFAEHYLNERKLITIADKEIVIDIENLDLNGTIHADERMVGRDITEEEIIEGLQKALPKIINDFANGEIPNNSFFLVRNRNTDLNIVGNLKMQKGKDFVSIITVMRKRNFMAKRGTLEYEI